MNKTKLLGIAVICLLVLNLGILAVTIFKEPGRHQHQPPGEGPKKIIIERLGFDEAQQKQYDVIVDEHRSKFHELNKKAHDLHDQLYSLLIDKTPDKARSDSLILEIAENQKAIDNLNFDHFQKIKAICKNDQLNLYNALVEDLTRLFSPHGDGPPPK